MTLLVSLLPIRDRRERIAGFELSTAPAADADSASEADVHARSTLDLVPAYSRLCGRSLLVPVTPAVLRDVSLARFASLDVTLLVATEALDDSATRRAVERIIGNGTRVALDGFPDGDPLPSSMSGAIVAIDSKRVARDVLARRIRTLADAGLRPMLRGVDDRAARLHSLAHGASLISGRQLARGASVREDTSALNSIVGAIKILALLADGRPADSTFDRYVENDERMSAMLLRAASSAAVGVRNARSVTHAISVLGRDVVLDNLAISACRLLGEAMHDPDFALAALRRVYFCDQIGASLDPAPHPRARVAVALLSMTEFALAESPSVLAHSHFGDSAMIVRESLVGRTQPLGQMLDMADAIDYGWWSDLRQRTSSSGIALSVVSDAYREAWRRAREDLALLSS